MERLRSVGKCMASSTGTSGVQHAAGKKPASAFWTDHSWREGWREGEGDEDEETGR